MFLSEYLNKDQIIPELSSTGKSDVLAELIRPLADRNPVIEREHVHEVLMTRENLGTTGIGGGVAIPHGKLDNLNEVMLIAGRSTQGVDFSSLDHKPVHIFFLVLAPEKSAGRHLKILAYISRLLQDQSFKEAFMRAESREEIWELITRR